MAAANPNSFDNYRRGQPCIVLKAKVDNKTFDYYRSGQPYIGEVIIPAATTTIVKDILKSGMVIPFNR